MKTYQATLQSVSPLIMSRMLSPHAGEAMKRERESHEDYDLRVWPLKAWATSAGNIFIPRVFFKRSLEEAAQFMGIQIPGKGKSTYTKHFLAGCQIASDLVLDDTREDLDCQPINCHADGKLAIAWVIELLLVTSSSIGKSALPNSSASFASLS